MTESLKYMSVLQELEQTGADRYNPVKFSYISALAKRLGDKTGLVREKLLDKVLDQLDDYKAAFKKARGEARLVAEKITQNHPQYSIEMDEAFRANDFKRIHRLDRNLEKEESRVNHIGELLDMLHQASVRLEASQQELSFDDMLRFQEDEILRSYQVKPAQLTSIDEKVVDPEEEAVEKKESDISEPQVQTQVQSASPPVHNAVDNKAKRRERRELKSVQVFRESWVKRYAEKLVSRVIEEGPENPGPLNPESLVIRSLTAMRDLSPEYLSRFVSYIDTLMWLEQVNEDMNPTKKKYR